MQCYHCGLDIITEVKGEIDGKTQSFCCHGCFGVAKFIAENNLESFYKNKQGVVKPQFENEYPLDYYDLDSFKDEFVANNKLTLFSPSIHCAACVFLIEKVLAKLPEVEYARVNLTSLRITINLSGRGKISNIFKTLADIGYSGKTISEDNAEKIINKQNQAMLRKIGFAFFTVMNMMWISIALYTGADEGQYHNYFLWLSFALATPTLFYSGFGFIKSSYYALKNLSLNMDVPITIGALTTYIYSCLVLFEITTGHIYFDTVVNFIFVILIGRYFEASSKKQVLTDTNSVASLDVNVATVLRANKEILTPVKTIKAGDIIVIKSGEKIALDGEIISGDLAVDESLLSGESLQVNKKAGDRVYSGTINTSGAAKVKVSKTYNNSSLSRIKNLINDAGIHKTKISCLIDNIIPYFVFSTIIVAALSFIYNFYLINLGFDFALMAAVSVLIITCPCAFGIATPITYTVANNILFKNKVIIRDSLILDNLDKIKTVVFDKTGTLTTAQFKIKEIKTIIKKDRFNSIIKSLTANSEHPLSIAINKEINSSLLEVKNFKNHPGFGISGEINNEKYFVGNLDFMQNNTKNTYIKIENHNSIVYLASENTILGWVDLVDEVAKNAKKLVKYLQNINKKVIILSGDSENSVKAVADILGVNEYYFKQSPEDKLNFIKNMDSVLMIGDGINDAAALKAATFSLAISGVDIVESNTSGIILKNNLKSIITLFKVANLSKKIIIQNISFALIYNLIFIPLAFLGKLNPIIAAIVMPISSLIVIFNALRIKLKFRE